MRLVFQHQRIMRRIKRIWLRSKSDPFFLRQGSFIEKIKRFLLNFFCSYYCYLKKSSCALLPKLVSESVLSKDFLNTIRFYFHSLLFAACFKRFLVHSFLYYLYFSLSLLFALFAGLDTLHLQNTANTKSLSSCDPQCPCCRAAEHSKVVAGPMMIHFFPLRSHDLLDWSTLNFQWQ